MPWHGRQSSVKRISQKPSSKLMPHFVERYLSTISPDNFSVFQNFGFLALLDFVSRATVMAQASVRPSVNSSFSETAAWIQAKFYGKLPIHHISRPIFVCFFKIFIFKIFMIFFFIFINIWDPMGAKISKRYSSSFHPI